MYNASATFDYLYKVIIIGDDCTGKSSLLARFSSEHFSESYIPTIGVDFQVRTVEINGNTIKAQLWDTAGQERFRTVTQSYYRGCHGAMIVFDVTNRDSFKKVEHWITDLEHYVDKSLPKILVANKCDQTETRCVTSEEASALAIINNMEYEETSAKLNDGVDSAFETLLIDINKKKDSTTEVTHQLVAPEIPSAVMKDTKIGSKKKLSETSDSSSSIDYDEIEENRREVTIGMKESSGMLQDINKKKDSNTEVTHQLVAQEIPSAVMEEEKIGNKKKLSDTSDSSSSIDYDEIEENRREVTIGMKKSSGMQQGEPVPQWALEITKELKILSKRMESMDKLENTVKSLSKQMEKLEGKVARIEKNNYHINTNTKQINEQYSRNDTNDTNKEMEKSSVCAIN